ncbi:PREDICTED: putative leucine-rich repeat receptor-like protein kinase At2g19210 [Tarenaya hassleriana]|uniref:putative leucine-rich repeat receptor-like protein kinase At2g19210 n=1 Tax=Tarenaya hassleriana TaxID=28532 RepID=UPI00053C6B75|nr:PREDICTED: putative leucine-rich repeat receptor-like protein kinase At2g19210 [Tarenaya hassleriana]
MYEDKAHEELIKNTSFFFFLIMSLPISISFVTLFLVVSSVHAQDQSGFVSIDCGIPDGSSYNDEKTDIKYVSDSGFVESGTSKNISVQFRASNVERQFYSVRSFPEGKRNCYDVQPPRGKGFKYLIRTRFMYGNYDGLGISPEFDLYLGVNLWDSVVLDNVTSVVTKEIIYTLGSDNVYICLVDKGKGTPFLSVLELRLLKNNTYATPYQALMLSRRLDLGAIGDVPVRYKDDVYDRIWMPSRFSNHRVLNTSLVIDPNNNNGFQPARVIMSTATTPLNASQDIGLYWEPEDPKWKFYVYMHFAEVEELPRNETREFRIFLGETPLMVNDTFTPRYLYTDTLFTEKPVSGESIEFYLRRTDKSTLPPIINAIERYQVNEFLQLSTDQQDVDAVMKIKSKYGVKKSWMGDPCAPVNYPWDGINCSYSDNEPPRIISLDLFYSGLTGEIDSAFSNLTTITKLDLSNNSLTGKVPDFLADLTNLKELNLEGNKLTGSIPLKLQERSNDGSLLLRISGNPDLCADASCQKAKKKRKNVYVIPLVASIAGLLVLFAALFLWWVFKKRLPRGENGGVKTGPLDTTRRYYKFSEVMKLTNNFERILGEGGFGKVYHGVLDGNEVAVKVLSQKSTQGYKEFRAEVELLLRVHHRNLTSLIGYCNEGNHMALIYEFMANGTLGDYLSGIKQHILSWEERLRISLDAAQGLEYLHDGCKPPIVHRDVKPANILLNGKLQAKIADFGLSRSFPLEGGTQVATVVAGTIGYLDPEYHATQQLSEKSDVYSFGVVLLEVVTGQRVISRSRNESTHISDRVGSMLAKGDIRSIVDPRLGDGFEASSAWKIIEIALASASQSSKQRPTMSQVVMVLKESVGKMSGHKNKGTDGREPTKMMSMNLDSVMAPQPR